MLRHVLASLDVQFQRDVQGNSNISEIQCVNYPAVVRDPPARVVLRGSPWFSPHDGRIRIHVSIGFSFQGNQTSFPIHSMYGIYAYIDPPNHPNVGIYGIHGASGYYHISYGSIAGHRFGGHGAPSRGLVIMSLVLKRACWSQAGCFIWRPIPCAQSWPLSGSGMALTMKRQQLRERDSVMVRMADTSLGKQSEILA